MTVIGNDGRSVDFQEIESTWNFIHMGAERFESDDDLRDRHTGAPASRNASQDVFDLE